MTEPRNRLDLSDWYIPKLEEVKNKFGDMVAEVVCDVFDIALDEKYLLPSFETVGKDPLTLIFELETDGFNYNPMMKVSVRDVATRWIDVADEDDLEGYKILSGAFRQLADDIDRTLENKRKVKN